MPNNRALPNTITWIVAIGLCLAAVIWLKPGGWLRSQELLTLREQFHLPADVEISKTYSYRKKRLVQSPTIEAVAYFPETQFRDYMSTLNKPSVWKPTPLTHDGMTYTGSYAPDALLWTARSSNREFAWGNLSERDAAATKNGKLLCFVIAYDKASRCADMPDTFGKGIIVQGLIDEDNRALHMLIRPVGRH